MTTAIQEYSKTDAALADLASRFKGVVYDVTTVKGLQEARTARAEIRGYRVDLEKVRVEIKAPALERCRLIDAEAKRITSALVELEDPIDSLIKNEEKRKEREAMEKVMAEQRRVDEIRARIEKIRQMPALCVGQSAEAIQHTLEAVQARDIGSDYAEFRVEAEDAKRSALAQLSVMLAGVQAQAAEAERIKAEREELARLRAEQAERERAGREALEADQRAAKAAREAEDSRIAQERAALEREREKAEAARREIQRRENEVLDARAMLATFKTRFGHLDEFAGIVAAIDALKKARKAA
jgi:colicin import membrane protein